LSARLLLSYNVPLLTSPPAATQCFIAHSVPLCMQSSQGIVTTLKFKILRKQSQAISMVCIFIWYRQVILKTASWEHSLS